MDNKVHWSFWAIAVFGLLWNIGGSINYIMQTDPNFVSGLPLTHKAIIESRPFWATGGFAIGVFGGTIGCALLLLRKYGSIYVLILSLAGIAVTMIHTMHVALVTAIFSFAEVFVMIVLPLIVAAILIWYASLTRRKGWIS